MSDQSEWLLRLEERLPVLRKTLLFIYVTKMSIAWAVVFFTLLVLACYEIRPVAITYVFAAAGAIVGIILLVLMIFAMTGEAKEVVWLRDLYHKFINSLENDPGNMWNPSTIEKFEKFQGLFKRICPEASINVPSWPDEGWKTETKPNEIKPIKSKPTPLFRTVEVRPDYTDREEIVYKSKVQIVLQSEQECFIKAAIWRADGGVALELPERLKLRPKNINGEWSHDEFSEIAIPIGGMFSTWIGLRGKLPSEVARKIHETKGFGTLLLKISGYDNNVEIPV